MDSPKLALVRTPCKCGWQTPKNLRIELSPWSQVTEIAYDCPVCGSIWICRPAGMVREVVKPKP